MNFKEAPAGLFTYKDKNYIKVNSQDDVVVDVAAGKFILDEFKGDEEVYPHQRGGYSFLMPFYELEKKMKFCDMKNGALFTFTLELVNGRQICIKVDDSFAIDIFTGELQSDFSCDTLVKKLTFC
jgi:hypothetical protein